MGFRRTVKMVFRPLVIKKKASLLLQACRDQKQPVKLHVACGRHYLDGWINIDTSSRVKTDLWLDVREGLPFPDQTVDFLFNEHFIEHLSYESALSFFQEVFRVLRPGGVLRTAFPDLDVLIDSYRNDTWREMEWVKLIDAQWYPSGGFMFNQFMREDGLHLYMYNKSELKRRLCDAGFEKSKINDYRVNLSRFPELENIEKRADSSVVEAVK